MKKVLFILLLISKTLFIVAQRKTIYFQNPSFEDVPFETKNTLKKSFKIEKKVNDSVLFQMGWFPCGFKNTSPPDRQPGMHGVEAKAAHGKYYLGLVTRTDTTWEGISQILSSTLQKDSCYQFSMHLMHSLNLVSRTTQNISKDVNFKSPCRLRIWGGTELCDPKELLIETPPIHNTKWKRYLLQFTPYSDVKYLYFEVYYGGEKQTLGNLMMDNLSFIDMISCK